MAHTERVEAGGGTMALYVDMPSGPGPHPGVVVAHHRGALDAFTRKFVEDLAAAGYAAAAPAFYHRRPEGEDVARSMAALDDAEMIADMDAAFAWLRGRAELRAGAVGIVGHCMGGRAAFLGAAAIPGWRACAVFYGGNVFKPWGAGHPAPIDRAAGIGCPVIGFFGNDDDNPSPDDVARIGAALDRHGVVHRFHAYDGAGHAFQNFLGGNYREAQAKDAQARLLDFLAAELGPAPRPPQPDGSRR